MLYNKNNNSYETVTVKLMTLYIGDIIYWRISHVIVSWYSLDIERLEIIIFILVQFQ